eukprot:gene16090-7442_t
MTDEEAAERETAIHIVTQTRNLKTAPFIIPEDANIIRLCQSSNGSTHQQQKSLYSRRSNTGKVKKTKEKESTSSDDEYFQKAVNNPTCGKSVRFVVVYGHINSPPLISKATLLELGMIKIQAYGGLAQPNNMKIWQENRHVKVAKQNTEMQKMLNIVEQYNHVFEGIGKIHDKRNNQKMYGKFNMRPKAAPIAQKPRQVPYYLQEPFKQWLDQGVQEDLFEKVPENEPITWCSPVVVQLKPSFINTEKEHLLPQMIHASVVLRVPNSYMERSRITQPPIVEDFVHKFHDCTIWSKLDLRQGYHQLVLDPESRSIATFSTLWGNYGPKRLVFGAKALQDLFDDAMLKIFDDIPRCLNQRDDILIRAKD